MTDLVERNGEPDLWASPSAPPVRPAATPSRFESVAVFVVGWGWALARAAFFVFVTWALWTEYSNGWLHAALVLFWIGYSHHLVCVWLHRRSDHRSDEFRSSCHLCHEEFPSHRRG
jgi:hypothetical protein